MDDDNSSSVRKDEVNNHPSADHSAQKTENKTEKVLPPTNGDNISKSGIWVLATEVVLLGGVATGVWVLGEHFASHGHTTIGGIADYAPAVLFFATLPLVALKRWARPVMSNNRLSLSVASQPTIGLKRRQRAAICNLPSSRM